MARRRSDKDSYARARVRAKARSAGITLAGQDIAPIPPVQDVERRKRADRDFRFFCESYFPHVFHMAWCEDHLRVIGQIERLVKRGETRAVAMPRGSGKTSLCQVAVQWGILAGWHAFVFLICADKDEARHELANVKTHLATNDGLLADYPEAVYPIRCLDGESRRCHGQRHYGASTWIEWGVEQIVFPMIAGSRASGAIVRVAGITGKIRGALYVRPDGTQARPSLVICDDPQTDASAKSPLQTAERLAIINGAVRGLAGPGRSPAIIVPCTVIQQDDLADQLLDRKVNPWWRGERTKMVYAFPKNEKRWADYARRLKAELAADGDGSEATKYYAARRKAMDRGAKVAWPERYNADLEISAIQHAMNLKIRDEAAFFAEYQNEPLRPEHLGGQLLTIRQVMEKANGRRRGEVPLSCTKLTMFIDVHDRLLYWAVVGWEEDFTGYVVEYDTFPRQGRRLFSMDAAARTLGRKYPGAATAGAIRAGLQELVTAALAKEYRRGQGIVRVDRLLVDMGYKPRLVADVKHAAGGATMWLSKGVGIRAAHKPMATYIRRPGETIGHCWYIPNVSKTAEFPHVAVDVNYWKTFVHRALATAAGDPTSLSLHGKAEAHELLGQHVAASEYWVETRGRGRTVHEWTPKASKPDNHWLDCLVGCAAAASMLGVKVPGEASAARERKRYTQADLSGKRT